MQFINTVLFAATALASMATANKVYFVNQDSTTRTIVFTGSENMHSPENIVINGLDTAVVEFDQGWIGNFYSVSEDAEDVPGMLGEITWNAWGGMTFFDVSAIVKPDDVNGVKMLFPKNDNLPVSGCQSFPCSNAYNKWNDIQTQSTTDDELVCLLGNISKGRNRGLTARVPHEFVMS